LICGFLQWLFCHLVLCRQARQAQLYWQAKGNMHVCGTVWCCRRFCEDRRQRLAWLREEGSSFGAWWRSLGAERRKQLTTEKGESILKVCLKVLRAVPGPCMGLGTWTGLGRTPGCQCS
jgi:hypothetical protein